MDLEVTRGCPRFYHDYRTQDTRLLGLSARIFASHFGHLSLVCGSVACTWQELVTRTMDNGLTSLPSLVPVPNQCHVPSQAYPW